MTALEEAGSLRFRDRLPGSEENADNFAESNISSGVEGRGEGIS